MSRWNLAIFLFACIFCVVQAFPQAEGGSPQSTTASSVEAALNNAMGSVQKELQKIMENPSVNKFVQDSQKFFQEALTTVQKEAAKIVPRTD